MDTLLSLPPELVAITLANLPLHSLLAFSATSKTNRLLAQAALQELNLAVFPRDLHGRLALVEQNVESTTPNSDVIKTTKLERPSKTSNPSDTLRRQVNAQNKVAADVLGEKFTANLKSLSLHMYDFSSPDLASVMAANLSKLRELDMRFCHPYIHDNALSSGYWKEASPGSPAWNALVGLGTENQKNLRLRNLHSLRVARAGLTSAQLRKFVESNPRLEKLHLDNVAGVDLEFVQWLGAYCETGRSRLQEITLQNCPQLKMQRLDDFAWLTGIVESCVRHLSLFRCRNVRHDMLVQLIDDEDEELELNTLETVVPPKGPPRHFGIAEEEALEISPTIVHGDCEDIMKVLASSDKIDVDPDFIAPAVTATA